VDNSGLYVVAKAMWVIEEYIYMLLQGRRRGSMAVAAEYGESKATRN
jgi:hypothetical protein